MEKYLLLHIRVLKCYPKLRHDSQIERFAQISRGFGEQGPRTRYAAAMEQHRDVTDLVLDSVGQLYDLCVAGDVARVCENFCAGHFPRKIIF